MLRKISYCSLTDVGQLILIPPSEVKQCDPRWNHAFYVFSLNLLYGLHNILGLQFKEGHG